MKIGLLFFMVCVCSMHLAVAMKIDLYQAIQSNNMFKAMSIIERAIDVNAEHRARGYLTMDDEGNEVFISKYDPSVLANPEAYKEVHGVTKQYKPLEWACECDNLAMAHILIENYGAEVNDDRGLYSNSLIMAIDNCNPVMAHYLLSRGAKIEQHLIDIDIPQAIQRAIDEQELEIADDLKCILTLLAPPQRGQPVIPVQQPLAAAAATPELEQPHKTSLLSPRALLTGGGCLLIAFGIKKLYDTYSADANEDDESVVAEQKSAGEDA